MEYESVKRNLRLSYDRQADSRDALDDPRWKRDERARFLDALRRVGAVTLLEIGAGVPRRQL